jgi:hypothetical protein
MPSDLPLPTDACGLNRATRRWLYLLVIVVAAVQGLASILTTSVLYSPARWPENRPPHTPLFSANDRSRWCTVWSLVERGTFAIDEIIRQPGWDTIDKVRYREHFYSSKPPLLPTLTAGLYWGLKRTAGLDLLSKNARDGPCDSAGGQLAAVDGRAGAPGGACRAVWPQRLEPAVRCDRGGVRHFPDDVPHDVQ